MSLGMKSPKFCPIHSCQNECIPLIVEKSSPEIVGYFCNFQKTAQCKHSPIGRKFAQSGHHGKGRFFLMTARTEYYYVIPKDSI
jgi:hypothetical protein